MLPLLREMSAAIFTRDRIAQLVEELRRYRNERFAEGDKATAGQAQGAIHYLEPEDSPGANAFLISLCWASIDSALQGATVETGPGAD